ncbi:MAG TPA: DUF4388 domain-containing protein, partial [Polyangiaceae bacterium]
CEKGLSCEPDKRFQSASEVAAALEPFQRAEPHVLVAELAQLVRWAQDQKELAKRIETKIRHSSQNLQAVRATSSVPDLRATQPARRLTPRPSDEPPRVRRVTGEVLTGVTFARIVELIATGELGGHDEVSLLGGSFRRIADIEELARHVLPSTTAITGRVDGPGAPNYQFILEDQPMLEALALLRQRGETGALFVVRGVNGRGVRKEIYLENGRLHHVVSSERNELLGEYLVRRGSLSRANLERALAELDRHQGRLGDTLIALELVGGVDLFRAIRDQGRDRVAALCAWKDGIASFYRGTQPTRVDFPLDLDLSNAMMAGVILRHKGEARKALPAGTARVVPGRRFETTLDPKELGRAPASLQRVARLTAEQLGLDQMLAVLTDASSGVAAVGEREAAAAIATAELLGWAKLVANE